MMITQIVVVHLLNVVVVRLIILSGLNLKNVFSKKMINQLNFSDSKMKISELIKNLKKIQKEHGNIETVVQYRGTCGEGVNRITDNIYLTVVTNYAGEEAVVL